jgi:hypothetical protein
MTKQPKRMSARRKSTPQETSGFRGKKLTVKQRKFIEGKLQGRSSASAARDAGYSESVAQKADAIIGSSPNVQMAFAQILEAAGVTDALTAQRIYEGLNATKARVHKKKLVEVPDYFERREMVELVCKLRGHLMNKHEHEIQMGDGATPRRIIIEYVHPKCGRCGAHGPAYGPERLCEKCAPRQLPGGMVEES